MDSDEIINNNICSVPWLHTEISLQTNSVFPCCKYKGPSLGQPKDFIKIWSGPDYSTLRTDLLNNIIRAECSACNVPTDAFSYKKFKNNSYKYLKQDITASTLPRIVHLTLKNTCNFACRMCHPSSSSSLHELSKKSAFLDKFYQSNINNKFNIKSIAGMFGNLQSLTITGGEPLIDEDIIEVLSMAERESTKFKKLTLSSNLSVIHPKIFSALKNTKARVNINVSIDGPVKIHEYIRHGCNWESIVKNLQQIKSICNGIGINSTISAMNIGYLHELIRTVQSLEVESGIKFTHIMPTPVLEPHLHVANLPTEIKKLYKEKLMSLQQDYNTPGANTLIQTGISLLESSVGSDITVVQFMEEFDKIANTDYHNIYPEWG